MSTKKATEVDSLRAKFTIVRHPDVSPKPLYTYRYKISGVSSGASEYLYPKRAIDETMRFIIADKKPENAHYVRSDEYLFSQFQLDLPTSLVGVPKPFTMRVKDETFEIQITREQNVSVDLNSGKIVDKCSIAEALQLMMQADLEKEEDFHVGRSQQGFEVFRLDNGERAQTSDGLWLLHRRGLNMEVKLDEYELTATESTKFFYKPANLVELLKLKKNKRLAPDLLKSIEIIFKDRLVRANFGNGEVSIHRIARVSDVPMCEDYVLCASGADDTLLKLVRVEERLRRQFPNLKLKYTNLPCLLTTRDKLIPMEICWLEKGQNVVAEVGHKLLAVKEPSLAERKKILVDNCNEIYRRSSATLKKFGFKIEPKRIAQSGLLRG